MNHKMTGTAALNGTHFRILLVDDDRNERSGVRFLIEREHLPLEILEASNGKQALEVLQEEPVDILFTDVKMPYMDGLELAGAVCERYPDIKIIIFSAYGEFEYAQKAMEARAISYLLKPVEVDKFYAVLNKVIAACHEKNVQKRKSQRGVLADQELMWIRLLSGKLAKEEFSGFERLGIHPGPDMTLMHLEAQTELFARQEEQIKDIVRSALGCRWEYINLYPNNSYLVLFETPEQHVLESLGDKLTKYAAQHSDQLSVLAARHCRGLEGLSERAEQLRTVRKQLITWGSSIQFLSELSQPQPQDYAKIESMKIQAAAAIDSGDQMTILSAISDLLDTMTRYGALSTIYIYHIFCELLSKLNSTSSHMTQLQQQMQILAGCRTPREILDLFDTILRQIDQPTAQDASRAVQKAIRQIRKEFASDLSLEYLAQSVGLAPSYFSYVFKRETGETLIKYLTDYRMQKAKELLNTQLYKVAKVAQLCGYDNPSYFNRLFKNTFGVTPTQYREKRHE